MALLFVKEGSAQERALELRGVRLSIGRAPDNAIQLEDRTVSRHHALLTCRPDGWYITDVGSRNSVFVNGSAVVEAKLIHDDEVRLGEVVLAFLDPDVEPAELSVPPPVSDSGITQTIRLSRFGRPKLAGERALSETDESDRRLRQLLRLAELAITVGGVEALFDGVVDILQQTLSVDRVIPILEEDTDLLRPYVASTHEFGESLEGLGVSSGVLQNCRRQEAAVAWSGAGRSPNIACAPVRVGPKNHGFVYCDRTAPAAEFTNRDLTYLLAVAMQTGLAIENIRSHRRLFLRAQSLSRSLQQHYLMVGESPAMQALYEFIRKVAPTNAGVLICGESGTGKEMVAQAVHRESRRSEGPLEIVNCAALPATLLESELFGHVRGSFTGAIADKPGRFELADGGSLFLDEVVELPLECQTKLLRALEEGRIRRVGDTRERAVDVRLIAATNRDVRAAVSDGRLREDLFYRLDRLRVEVPPLRERCSDIDLLAEHFLEQLSVSLKRGVEGFGPEVMEVFRSYRWPGNVRELRNVVERMVLLSSGKVLTLDDVPADLRATAQGGAEALSDVERRHILRVLEETGGNKRRAAQRLGIDRSTLYARLKRYGVKT